MSRVDRLNLEGKELRLATIVETCSERLLDAMIDRDDAIVELRKLGWSLRKIGEVADLSAPTIAAICKAKLCEALDKALQAES